MKIRACCGGNTPNFHKFTDFLPEKSQECKKVVDLRGFMGYTILA
jgi:hypothetical protein